MLRTVHLHTLAVMLLEVVSSQCEHMAMNGNVLLRSVPTAGALFVHLILYIASIVCTLAEYSAPMKVCVVISTYCGCILLH